MIGRSAVKAFGATVAIIAFSGCTTVADRGLGDGTKASTGAKKASPTTAAGAREAGNDANWLRSSVPALSKAVTQTALLCSGEGGARVLDCGLASVASPIGAQCPEATGTSTDRARCEPSLVRGSDVPLRFGWLLSAPRGQVQSSGEGAAHEMQHEVHDENRNGGYEGRPSDVVKRVNELDPFHEEGVDAIDGKI